MFCFFKYIYAMPPQLSPIPSLATVLSLGFAPSTGTRKKELKQTSCKYFTLLDKCCLFTIKCNLIQYTWTHSDSKLFPHFSLPSQKIFLSSVSPVVQQVHNLREQNRQYLVWETLALLQESYNMT